MSEGFDPRIRVVKAGQELDWQVIPTEEGDPNPPGEEVSVFRSGDEKFVFGLWKRAPETGPMDLPYHEIAVIIEGEVEVTEQDGTVYRVGVGDVLITPRGSKATWKALSPVKQFRAIYKE